MFLTSFVVTIEDYLLYVLLHYLNQIYNHQYIASLEIYSRDPETLVTHKFHYHFYLKPNGRIERKKPNIRVVNVAINTTPPLTYYAFIKDGLSNNERIRVERKMQHTLRNPI